MNKKLIGAIMVAIAITGAIGGYMAIKQNEEGATTTPAMNMTATVEAKPLPEEMKISCNWCHRPKFTKKLPQHVNGGKYCMGSPIGPCHSAEKYGGPNATVHTIHNFTEVTCRMCHFRAGEITVPTKLKNSTCDRCHDPDDPLKPSYGNLIEIHLGRNKSCRTCHAQPISVIHKMATRTYE